MGHEQGKVGFGQQAPARTAQHHFAQAGVAIEAATTTSARQSTAHALINTPTSSSAARSWSSVASTPWRPSHVPSAAAASSSVADGRAVIASTSTRPALFKSGNASVAARAASRLPFQHSSTPSPGGVRRPDDGRTRTGRPEKNATVAGSSADIGASRPTTTRSA
jgi:hypothetical protein